MYEVGKSYKTRDGRKANVLAQNFSDIVVGEIEGEKYKIYHWWANSGQTNATREGDEDLTTEWVEPDEIQVGDEVEIFDYKFDNQWTTLSYTVVARHKAEGDDRDWVVVAYKGDAPSSFLRDKVRKVKPKPVTETHKFGAVWDGQGYNVTVVRIDGVIQPIANVEVV